MLFQAESGAHLTHIGKVDDVEVACDEHITLRKGLGVGSFYFTCRSLIILPPTVATLVVPHEFQRWAF